MTLSDFSGISQLAKSLILWRAGQGKDENFTQWSIVLNHRNKSVR
jgi:hypothetical protein